MYRVFTIKLCRNIISCLEIDRLITFYFKVARVNHNDTFTPTGVLGSGIGSSADGGVKIGEPRRLLEVNPSQTLESDPTTQGIEQLYFKGGRNREKGGRVSAMRSKLLSKTAAFAQQKTSTPIGEDDVGQNTGM